MTRIQLCSSLLILLCSMAGAAVQAQHVRTATLSETEVDAGREAAVFPVERVNLYTKFPDQRAAKIKDIGSRPKSAQRVLKLDDLLQDFTALMDEAGRNFDQYS